MRLRARDVIEDHEGAERAVALHPDRRTNRPSTGRRSSTSVSATASSSPAPRPLMRGVGAAPAVFDQAGLDMAVLDHHGVVEHRHVGHAAVAMAGVEIGAEHRILLGGRHRDAHLADDVGIALGDRAACCASGGNRRRSTRTETQARQASQAGR